MIAPFTKMQGVGNDFILFDARLHPGGDWTSLAPSLCDRQFGIGADGILVIEESIEATARMRMYNPDGTEDFCGNGLRCAARYVSKDQNAEIVLETLAGIREAKVQFDPAGNCLVSVGMGYPIFEAAKIPVIAEPTKNRELPDVFDLPLEIEGELLKITTISTGTVHTVIFVDILPEGDRFVRLSSALENHPLFPERTSVMWVVPQSKTNLLMRIWERGAGETLGCGSGACAATVAAQLHGFVAGETRVRSRGGELTVTWSSGTEIKMTGPAVTVFHGEVDI